MPALHQGVDNPIGVLPMMAPDKILPTLMIVESVGAAVACAWSHNWSRTVYWGAAAVLTFSVTWMRV